MMVDGLRSETSGFVLPMLCHALPCSIAMLPFCDYVARSQVHSVLFLSMVYAYSVFLMASSELVDVIFVCQTYRLEESPGSIYMTITHQMLLAQAMARQRFVSR
jgi:hypothetical protein